MTNLGPLKCFGMPDHGLLQNVDTPVGERCTWCEEPIAQDDKGFMMIHMEAEGLCYRPHHYECEVRALFGSVAHQMKLCSCYKKENGLDHYEHPKISRRQEAQLAALYYDSKRKGAVYTRDQLGLLTVKKDDE